MDIVCYRKKPVVIQAVEVKKGGLQVVADWCGGKLLRGPTEDTSPYGILIPTLEGDHGADFGDFIIKGVKGEFYPCKPDIFWLTYDKVSDE